MSSDPHSIRTARKSRSNPGHSLSSHDLSFEFFPPKTPQGQARLTETRKVLRQLSPDFFSVTFGAGGSTRDGTYQVISDIVNADSVTATPHISCIGSNIENTRDLLRLYQQLNVRQLVVIRGDRPSGMVETGQFRHAVDLVSFIRNHYGDHFEMHVAAYPEYHPEAKDSRTDFRHFEAKVKAGATAAITQYFYNPDAYFYFLDRCQQSGIDIPVVPGIMPITNYRQLYRFSSNCGAEIPRWILQMLELYQDDLPSLRAFGIDVVVTLCERLIQGGAPGLHLYTLNRHQTVWRILQGLKLTPERGDSSATVE